MHRIAVILTCFNRRDTTLDCLHRLSRQTGLEDVQVDVHLVDDGSSDGTGAAVRERFPAVSVIDGDGDLFWNRGMVTAWNAAIDTADYDGFLWMNDDTLLDPDTVATMVATHAAAAAAGHPATIVVGSIADPETGGLTYGGHVRFSRWNGIKTGPVEPQEAQRRELVTFNGNCVLVPREVTERIGTSDPVFHHSWGDIDYGLRATGVGCRIVTPARYVGTCAFNIGTAGYTRRGASLRARWKHMRSIHGLNGRDWRTFTRRHGGRYWPAVWLSPYVNMVVLWARDRATGARA
jgi:GT2 family glycosyltransferase